MIFLVLFELLRGLLDFGWVTDFLFLDFGRDIYAKMEN